MKKILGLALAGALSVAALPAVAADYPMKAPPPPIWSWTGFYIGVSGGGITSGAYRYLDFAPQVVGGLGGGIAGGTIGWNWQSGIWVFGVEGDWSWANAEGNQACPNAAFACGAKVDWLATARVRLGVASLGSTMFYITGGGAWARVARTATTVATGATGPDQPLTLDGWTGGGGVEFMVAPNWTFKGEVLWVDLGSKFYPAFIQCGGGCTNSATRLSADFFVYRAGVNFKF